MLIQFFALTLIWGASFLFIKLGLACFTPQQISFGRMATGALTLLILALVRKERLPREPRLLGHLAVAGLLANTLPFTLFPFAEERISTALASIGNATVPLFTLPFALLLLPSERPTVRRVAGLLVGFVGVLLVLGVWRGQKSAEESWGFMLTLLAAASYGLSAVYMRRYLSHTSYSSLALAVGQIGSGAFEAVPLLLWSPTPTAPVTATPLLAVFLLGAFGTGIAYALSHQVIRQAGATVFSMVTYFIPVVSVAIGVIGLGERLDWNAPVGALVIIAGAFLTRGASPPPRLIRDQPAPQRASS